MWEEDFYVPSYNNWKKYKWLTRIPSIPKKFFLNYSCTFLYIYKIHQGVGTQNNFSSPHIKQHSLGSVKTDWKLNIVIV